MLFRRSGVEPVGGQRHPRPRALKAGIRNQRVLRIVSPERQAPWLRSAVASIADVISAQHGDGTSGSSWDEASAQLANGIEDLTLLSRRDIGFRDVATPSPGAGKAPNVSARPGTGRDH